MIQGPGDLSHAIIVATHASRPFVDKQGQPIILHAIAVMMAAPPSERVPAVLHDVIEETAATATDLLRAGFSAADVAIVDALTRRKSEGETYRQYIQRVIAAGPRAQAVKLADLNINLGRVHELDAFGIAQRLEVRYTLARHAIMTGTILDDLR